jgi:hypothetical protein
MRWQLLSPWPHGAITIPAATEITGIAGADGNISAIYNTCP